MSTREEYFQRGEANIYYDLVPRAQVELDMMSGDSIVSSAARDYFRENYATYEQKIKMDLDDVVNKIAGISIVGVLVVSLVFYIVQSFIK